MKKVFIGLIILVFVFTGYLILFGKLFPYSPVIIGFSKYELANTIFYIQKGTEYKDYAEIDTLIPSIERFHDLKFIRKPELFVFRDSSAYIRHSPSKARFCAFPSGRLFISPWALKEAREGNISLKIYVKHELSHVLIFQYKGILSELKYPKWLLEGIAVYSANQMGTSFYPSKEETYHAIALHNFLSPFCFKTNKEDLVELNVKNRIPFMYSEFACIVDYLIANYGKEKFLLYMKSLIKENDHNIVFKKIYGVDFDIFLSDFRQFVMKNDSLKTT